jgi:hypothetical protein
MSNTWQFRFAVHAGITVVYPVRSPREPSAAGRFPKAKFAIAGRKPVRVIYPVEGLESLNPTVIEARKDGILSVLNGQEKPKSNTVLNTIVRGLGLAADWGVYKKEYDEKLLPFLKDKGLTSHRSLLGREPDGIICLTHRQVADLLFASGRKIPSRLFTGLGFDYWQLLELALAQPDLRVEDCYERAWVTGPLDHSKLLNNYRIHGEGGGLSYLDALNYFSNLLGDQLCDGGSAPPVLIARVYLAEPAEALRLKRGLEIFQRLLRLSERGWVNVIPYNKNLAFLSDGVGGFDFVFRNLRDEVLPISAKDGPDTVTEEDKDQAFGAWSYFDYTGWREQDEHVAEEAFYAKGGTLATYPSSIAVLRDLLTRHGKYTPQMLRTATDVDFTPLVTIRAFRQYLWEVDKIGKAKGNDPWLQANGEREEDEDLPVAVNWEEAADYARWMNSKGHRQCRLPTEDEYREAFASLTPAQISTEDVKQALAQRLVDFISPDGEMYEGHPPYMDRDEFAMLTMRYRVPVPMESGVVRSAYFGEWLEPEGAAINGLFFCAQFEVAAAHVVIVSPSRARLPRYTTGKYKSMKIGFRLALLD